eukprot:2651105-Amphidinium_carterae.1
MLPSGLPSAPVSGGGRRLMMSSPPGPCRTFSLSGGVRVGLDGKEKQKSLAMRAGIKNMKQMMGRSGKKDSVKDTVTSSTI